MRFTAPIAALALAGVAWIGCWQQIQLVRLKRQVKAQQPVAAAPVVKAPAAVYHPPALSPVSQLDQLRDLLVQREEAIADARDASADFGIAEGSPDMDRAILLATQDLDRAIIKLAGPAAATQLAMTIPRATVPPDVQVAPAPAPAPAAASSTPAFVPGPATNVYVNVAAAAPVYLDAPAPAADPNLGAYALQPAIYGGLGASFGRQGRNHTPKLSEAEKAKFFAAGAGIPLSGSPLGSAVVTSPLLLSRQRTATVASGR